MNDIPDSPKEESPNTNGGTSQTPQGTGGQEQKKTNRVGKVASKPTPCRLVQGLRNTGSAGKRTNSEDTGEVCVGETHLAEGRGSVGSLVLILFTIVCEIIAALIAHFIYDFIQARAWASPSAALYIGILTLLVLVCFVPVLIWRQDPKRKRKIVLLAVVVAIPAVVIIVWSAPLYQWRFEDGSVQGWGEYQGAPDKNTPPAPGVPSGIALPSEDVVASQNGEPSRGKHALKVENIIPLLGENDAQKWPAVNLSGETLRGTRLRAKVFASPEMTVQYADVKFFLQDANWKWRESGTPIPEKEDDKLGTVLIPGTWVDLSWDLGSDEAKKWPTPWKNVLGIKILLKGQGQFDGPIYIDDITVSRRLPWLSTD